MVFYFAYGSNMNYARMRGRKAKWTKKLAATLHNFTLRFNTKASTGNWSAANIIKKRDAKVEGVLYKTDEKSLKKIDKYEGVPHHYKRVSVTVQVADGKNITAITYIAHPPYSNTFTRKKYLHHLLKGKPYLSKAYYAFLLATKVVD